jgi:hypothetical protein
MICWPLFWRSFYSFFLARNSLRVRAHNALVAIGLWLTLIHIHGELWVSDSLKGHKRFPGIAIQTFDAPRSTLG